MKNWEITEIEDVVRESVQKFTGVLIPDSERHMFSSEYGIIPADFLYVFQELENIFHFPVVKILENYDYTIFTISNLAKAIYESLPASDTI